MIDSYLGPSLPELEPIGLFYQLNIPECDDLIIVTFKEEAAASYWVFNGLTNYSCIATDLGYMYFQADYKEIVSHFVASLSVVPFPEIEEDLLEAPADPVQVSVTFPEDTYYHITENDINNIIASVSGADDRLSLIDSDLKDIKTFLVDNKNDDFGNTLFPILGIIVGCFIGLIFTHFFKDSIK